jgi:hypothetical protein
MLVQRALRTLLGLTITKREAIRQGILAQLCALFTAASVFAGGENHFGDNVSAVGTRSDLNGMGVLFRPTEPLLLDASVCVGRYPGATASNFWSDAHLEIRTDPPGSIFGQSGNVLFRSQRVDFFNLPLVNRQISFDPTLSILEVKLSDFGLTHPIVVTPGQWYDLLLVNYTPVTGGHGEYLTAPYPGVGTGHNVAYSDTFWAPGDGLLWKTITDVPEPTTSGAGLLALLFVVSSKQVARTTRQSWMQAR